MLIIVLLSNRVSGHFAYFLKPKQSILKPTVPILMVPAYFSPSLLKSTKQLSASFACNAARIWNDLPAEIHPALSLSLFSCILKAFVFETSSLHAVVDGQKD